MTLAPTALRPAPCARCGRTRRTATHSTLCHYCVRDRSQALTGGRWVRHGLIWRWVEESLWDVLERNLGDTCPPTVRRPPLCAVCGCLLAASDESCPACLAWAERNAIRHSWRRRYWWTVPGDDAKEVQ